MSAEVHIEGDACVVVRGELDMATTPALTSAIGALAGTGTQHVTLDLAGVTFIDSTAIAALCLAKAELTQRGAVLVLGPASSQVETMLQVVGLESEFVRETHAS